MHETLQELIDQTNAAFQLTDFHLKRYHIFKEKNQTNEITYIFNMEWFPNHQAASDDDINPPGTISIDIDFHTKALRNIIFVNGVNKLEANLPEAKDTEGAIEWIEEQTGLEFGRQFKLIAHDTSQLRFYAAADNIPVFPPGHIDLDFNDEGKLSLFSIYGTFPEADKISWEPFDLTSEDTEEMIKKQCTLFEVPIVDQERWQNVFGISNSFITNKEKNVLSYEEIEADVSFTPMKKMLEWDTAFTREFSTQDIDIGTESTLEAALANEQPNPNEPLTEKQQQKVVAITNEFLQSIVPEDSGKWKIVSVRREAGYLFIELKLAAGDTRILQRKITVFLDSKAFEPVNYIDNAGLLDTFQALAPAAEPKLSMDAAFEILSKYVEVTPVYVYNKEQDMYQLCGKVNCDYAVDAATGELITFDDLN